MGVYHAGAVAGLRDGGALHRLASNVVGASAGALVGALVATGGLEQGGFLERYLPLVLDSAARSRREPFGLLTPGYRLVDDISRVLLSELPPDAHLRASGRLHVAVTTVAGGAGLVPRQAFVSEFGSRDSLVEAVVRSCAIPGITAGWRAPGGGLQTHRTRLGLGLVGSAASAKESPECRERWAIDGGLVCNWPAHPASDCESTLFIAPFAGGSFDICPAVSEPIIGTQTPALMGMPLEISWRNAQAIVWGFFPPPPEVLEEVAARAYRDAVAWCAAARLQEQRTEAARRGGG
jgi:patatin-like phospholipase domain-containing protein 2